MATDDHEDILNKLKAWAVPGLGGVVMLLLTLQINSAVKRMDEAIEKVNSMTTKTEVANAQYGFLVERVKNLEDARKDAGEVHTQIFNRMGSLEQRAAISDQFMQTHK
ncbi:hypothetical protein [Hymenobacter cheonanensis]|uniref:hypothetical protein n=1 Tax=Hymenobacter sp. CA2-7 TaxID=3063993 RepID=UPI0027143059|nr:hypothetical protein [Hymenobacter sp. CA2-7]MDO7886706.1 hypothetical protein [Hymenobacter sp. CA2-7]